MDRTRSVHGLDMGRFADNSCSRPWKNRGKFLAAAWTKAWRSCGISQMLPGNCPDVAQRCLEINRTRPGCCADTTGTLPGMLSGCFARYRADARPDIPPNIALAVAWTFA